MSKTAADYVVGRDITHPERTLPGGAVTSHLACPFCDQPPDPELGFHDGKDGNMWWVECTSGFATCIGGPSRPTPAAAWHAWDTRAVAADMTALFNDLLTHLRRVTLLHDPAFVRCFLTADLDGDLDRYRNRLAAVLRGA